MHTIYSRDRDGNLPVHILDNGQFQIHYPDKIIECPSARQLIITLTGHPEARHWTFDRYFRQGSFTPPELTIEPITPIIELFEPGGIIIDSGSIILNSSASEALTIHPESIPSLLELETFPLGDLPKDSGYKQTRSELGIDLEKRGHEVAKLLFAGFGTWIFSKGYDPQDVLQEVYKGILIRNQGTCPFDARKSSFGHYVHQICHCIVSNYHRKESRRYESEQVGVKVLKDGQRKECDVSDAMMDTPAKDPRRIGTMEYDLIMVLKKSRLKDKDLAIKILHLLGYGYSQKDMAEYLEVSRKDISDAVNTVRKVAYQCGYRKNNTPIT